ncbi:hypothetical protein HYX14_02445 [Candidatus Woesearchaeota archaeon]|nr:hypothetical protein [Candidatus Woesearchaeota archaeon]
MNQKLIVGLILAVLVLVSVVQAVQLYGLKDKISSGTLSVKSTSSAAPVASSGGKQIQSVPSSVKELPSMVGGC